MRYEFKPSFEDSIKNFNEEEKEEVKTVAIRAVEILAQNKHAHKGIGMKRLKGDCWEIRHGIKTRIIFRWSADLVEFILAGSHDEVKRYLKNS